MPITAYMHKILLRPFNTSNTEDGRVEIPRLLQSIYDRFREDFKFYYFSYRLKPRGEQEEKKEPDQLIMDHLRFDGDILFGTIGVAKKEMVSLIRERDPVTLEQRDLSTTTPGNFYEYYTFFAISALSGKLLILRNAEMPSYTHNGIITILNIAKNDSPYAFEITSYSEDSVLKRLKEMKSTKLSIVVDSNEVVPAGMPSIRHIEQAANRRTKCTVSMNYRFDTELTNEVIDSLFTLKEEGGVRTLVVNENKPSEQDPDKVDLLKDLLLEKRKLQINKSQSKDADLVHQHMIKALRSQSE